MLCAWPATARSALTVAERSPERGWIGLRVTGGAPRGVVTVREGAARLARIRLDAEGRAAASRVAHWRCDRRARTLTVLARGRAGVEVSTETPGCDRRLVLRPIPRRPRAGGRLRLRILDRWRLGRLDVCVSLVAPGGAGECLPARLGRGGAALRLRAPRPGRWKLELRGTGVATVRTLRVRPRRGPLAVLATGDSMMAPVARNLRPMLSARAGASVLTDVHYGAGISNSFVLDWREHARELAAQARPDVVVLFIGGHEGWPLGPVQCCDAPWVALYADRARAIVRSYKRRGAAQVYVLSLPAPQESSRVLPFAAVDAGLAQAAAGLGPGVRVLDLSAIFTPGFLYRSVMPVAGRPTVVRMADGLHLTPAGGAIAAQAVVSALERDAVLAPCRAPARAAARPPRKRWGAAAQCAVRGYAG